MSVAQDLPAAEATGNGGDLTRRFMRVSNRATDEIMSIRFMRVSNRATDEIMSIRF